MLSDTQEIYYSLEEKNYIYTLYYCYYYYYYYYYYYFYYYYYYLLLLLLLLQHNVERGRHRAHTALASLRVWYAGQLGEGR